MNTESPACIGSRAPSSDAELLPLQLKLNLLEVSDASARAPQAALRGHGAQQEAEQEADQGQPEGHQPTEKAAGGEAKAAVQGGS